VVVPVLHGQPGHSVPFPGQGDRSQHHPPQCGQKGKDTNILPKKTRFMPPVGDFFAMNPEGLPISWKVGATWKGSMAESHSH